MESLQSYGIYLIILGGLFIIAGLIMGFLATLPTPSTVIDIPNRTSENATEPTIVPPPVNTQVLEPAPSELPTQSTPNTSSTGSIAIDVIEKLDRLIHLREQGAITDEQYDSLRKQLLDS